MGLPYEYKLLVKTFPILPPAAGTSGAAGRRNHKELLAPVAKYLEEKLPGAIIGSGWTVNSHSIMIEPNEVVLCVLIQRGYL